MAEEYKNFKVAVKGTLADENDTEVKVLINIKLEIENGKIVSVIWPEITEINKFRSQDEKLGSMSSGYTISQIQKAYNKLNS